MYSVKQVADLSGRTERQLWRLIASGKLPHTKTDGRVWIAESDVPTKRQDSAQIALSAVLARLEAIERRLAALEARAIVPAARPTVAPLARTQHPPHNAETNGNIPTSQRGWARWIERHGGARESGARDWSEAIVWSSAAEAIAGIRQRGYDPHACDDPACPCHTLLT